MLTIEHFSKFLCKTLIGIILVPLCSFAEIISVNQISEGFFISSAPTLTYVYRSNHSARTLIFIPGGDGSVGVKPGWTNSRYFRENSFNL